MRTRMTTKTIATTILLCAIPFASAQEAAPAALDVVVVEQDSLLDLLDAVEQRRITESKEHNDREARFTRDKASQAQMLKMRRLSVVVKSSARTGSKPSSKKTKYVLATWPSNWINAWVVCANSSGF
jgi:hypothetical protein